jgi:hypothetical protein
VIEAPGAGAVPRLSDPERQALAADVARERAALATAETDLRTADATLTTALAAARGASIGSEAWTQAQLALSRFDSARAPLRDSAARTAPLQRTVDSLPEADSDRRTVDRLVADIAAAERSAAARAAQAERALIR